jgi:hypothetical protein
LNGGYVVGELLHVLLLQCVTRSREPHVISPVEIDVDVLDVGKNVVLPIPMEIIPVLVALMDAIGFSC